MFSVDSTIHTTSRSGSSGGPSRKDDDARMSDTNDGASTHSETGIEPSPSEGWSGASTLGEFHPRVEVQGSKANRGSSNNSAEGVTSANIDSDSDGSEQEGVSSSDHSDSDSIAELKDRVKTLTTEVGNENKHNHPLHQHQ